MNCDIESSGYYHRTLLDWIAEEEEQRDELTNWLINNPESAYTLLGAEFLRCRQVEVWKKNNKISFELIS